MKNWIKIGKSSRSVDVRSRELDNTAVPLPFEIYATLKTSKYAKVEKLIHKTIDRLTDLRIRQNREFFNIHPQIALDILKDIATTIDDAELDEIYLKNSALQNDNLEKTEINTAKTRQRFKFSIVNIPIGATIVFTPINIEVKVASDDKIEYQGRLYKLSPFVETFMPHDMKNTSGAYQGAKYFTYQGRILNDIRAEMEQRK